MIVSFTVICDTKQYTKMTNLKWHSWTVQKVLECTFHSSNSSTSNMLLQWSVKYKCYSGFASIRKTHMFMDFIIEYAKNYFYIAVQCLMYVNYILKTTGHEYAYFFLTFIYTKFRTFWAWIRMKLQFNKRNITVSNKHLNNNSPFLVPSNMSIFFLLFHVHNLMPSFFRTFYLRIISKSAGVIYFIPNYTT